MPDATLLASFFPEIKGWLEAIFVGLLVILAAAVGVFAIFLIANQFRNPGRRPGEGP